MPIIAAICDGCGTVYSFGITLVDPATRAMAGHTTGPCPRCGAMGTVPDGLYDIFRDIFGILARTPREGLSLWRLAALVRQARFQGMDSESTAIAIETKEPEFARLANDIRDRNCFSLYQYLSMLLIVIEAVIVERPLGDLAEQQIDQIYLEFVEAHPVIAPSAEVAAASRPIQYRGAMARRRPVGEPTTGD